MDAQRCRRWLVLPVVLLLSVTTLVEGLCNNGQAVLLAEQAGYFSSDGSAMSPDPPPSGMLPAIPATDPVGSEVLPANLNCTWVINPGFVAHIGQNVTNIYVDFFKLSLEAGDFLYIHEGADSSGLLLQTYMFSDPPSPFYANGSALTIVFVKSSQASNSSGFGAYYQSGACMFGIETLEDMVGTIWDGSGNATYAPGLQCAWLIRAPSPSSYISFSAASIIEAGFDYINIYDGQDNTARRIAISTDYLSLFSVDTSGPYAYMTFFTDKRTELYGFDINYQVNADAYCSGVRTFEDSTGQISDGSGDGNYLPNSDCGFLIESGVSNIEIFFSQFNLGSGDSLSIYAGSDASGTLLTTFTAASPARHASYAASSLFLHFTSDGSDEGQGFILTYHAGTCTVTAELRNEQYGSINDGSSNDTYAVFMDCLWLFDISGIEGASRIAYNFTRFDLEFQYDFVFVYDGPTTLSPLMFRASGAVAPGTYSGETTGKQMLVRFRSDDDTGFSGWDMSYRAVYPSTSTDDTPLIVGLTVGLGGTLFLCLLLLLLLLILVLLFWKRKAPDQLVLKAPDFVAITWDRPLVEDPDIVYQEYAKRFRVLEKLLLNPVVVAAIAGITSVNEMSEVSYSMVLIHQTNNKAIKMIRILLLQELGETAEGEIPLREESMATMAFKVFAHMVGIPYIWEIFALPIAELEKRTLTEERRKSISGAEFRSSSLTPSPKSDNRRSRSQTEMSLFSISTNVEMNPEKLEKGQDKKLNQLQLQLLIQKIFVKIISSMNLFPPPLRYLFYKLHGDLQRKHADLDHLVFGNLIFLRFLCPALILPQKYGITSDNPHKSTQRTLILMAKVLQNLSNKVEFGNKEPFMLPMNRFIEENIPKVEAFFDDLGTPVMKPLFGDPKSSIVPNAHRKQAMITMYKYVTEHAEDIELKVNQLQPEKDKTQKISRALAYVKGMETEGSLTHSGSHTTSRSSHSDGEVIWGGD